MSKTIKQIAEELGVSKQAIHQKRKSKRLSTSLRPFTSIIDGVVYISVDGENLIKQAFSGDNRQQVYGKKPSTVDDNVDGLLPITIETLKKQLETKDVQINEKDIQIAMLQKLIDQQQQLQLADKVHSNPLLEITDKKKGWKFWNKKQI